MQQKFYKLFQRFVGTVLLMMVGLGAMAQQLEMGSGGASTTATGPSTADQTITLQRNVGTSTTFTSTTPAFTVKVKLSNQAYTTLTENGIVFGTGGTNLYVPVNNIGSPLSNMFTSSPDISTTGTNYDVANNYASRLYLNANYQDVVGAALNARNYYGDITVEFSRPVIDPVVQIAGVGGGSGSGSTALGFFAEFELSTADVSAGITLTRLSGSTNFTVDASNTKVTNTSSTLGTTAQYASSQQLGSSGSIRINSSGKPITSVTFRAYLRGNGGGTSWASSGGDAFTIGSTVNLVTVSGNVFRDLNALTDGTVNGTGTNAGGTLFVNLVDSTTNLVIASVAVNSSGVYTFSDVVPSVYNLILTNGATTVGSTLTTATYPATWFSTGENLGSGAGSDATVDGKLKVSVTADLTNANFGVNSCAAGSTAPPLSGTTGANVCPSTTFNLNSLHTGTAPSGTSLVWFTNSTHTGSAYATPTAAFSGTYYGFYYDATNDCYSPATAAVTVTTGMCYKPVAQNILNAAINNNAAQSPILGLIASDASGLAIASYTIKTIPTVAQGVLYTCSTNDVPCSGTYSAVVANQVLTPAQAASLYFDPAKTFVGTASFTYDATNANGTSNTATVGVPVINNPPTVASFSTDAVAAGSSNNKLPSLIGSDGDGTVASYLVNPASSGTLTYCTTPPSTGCGTVISAATTLTPAQAATLSYNTAAGFTGNATFTYTATDDNGNASTAGTVTIPVTTLGGTPTNLPPVTQNVVSAPLNSNSASTLISSLVGTDPDGSITKYTIASIPSAATGVLYYCTTGNFPCTGTLTAVTAGLDLTPAQATTLQFDPAAGNNAPATFTYTATDNSGAVSNTSTFTIPIINLAPIAENTYANIPKDGTNVPVPPLVGIDGDGTIASYTVATVPNSATQGTLYYCSTGTTPCTGTQVAITAGATLTPAQAGTVNFTPVTGYTGTATATYTTTDNNGNVSVPATMTLNIVPAAGISPVASGSNTSMNANAGITALATTFLKATDPDGTISSYVVSAIPTATQGTYFYCTTGTAPCTGTLVALTAGTSLTTAQAASLRFTPNVNYTGPAPLSFYAVDNNGNSSNVATSFVDVVNIPPVAKGYTTANAALDGSTVSTPITATDIDGTVSRYTITTIPDASTGTLRYCVTPPSTGCGTAVTAGLQLTPAQAATLNFLPAAGIAKVNEVPFTFTATDNSGALSNVATVIVPFAATAQPVAQNLLSDAMNNNAAQTHIPGLSASDPTGAAIDSYVVKTLPTAAQGVLYTCSTNSVPCTGTYNPVAVNQVLTPAQAATLYFDPAKTFSGNASFTYNAISVNGLSNIATETIPVYNNPPTVASFTTGRTAMDTANVKVPALHYADGDGTVASVTIIPPSAAQGTLTYCVTPPSTGCGTLISGTTTLTPAQSATLHFNPATGFTGNATFQYRVTDDNGLVSDNGTVTIPVTPWAWGSGANLPPVTQNVMSAPVNTSEAATLISNLVGTDPDGSLTKYTIATIPTAATGVLYYCTTGNYPCTGTLTAVTAGTDLTLAQAATLQFDPVAGNNSPAVFTYTTTDNSSAVSNTSTFTIPVVNVAPTAQNLTTSVLYNSTNFPLSALKAADPDGTVAKYTISTVPNPSTEGTVYYCSTGVLPCTGSFIALTAGTDLTPAQAATANFTPVTGYTGTTTATYTATDNNGNVSAPATITMVVSSATLTGTPPLAKGSDVSLNTSASNTYLATNFLSATDLDGTVVSYSILSIPSATQGAYFYCSSGVAPCTPTALTAGTTLTAAQAATLSFTPTGTYVGPAPLNFYATDNSGNTSSITTSVVNLLNNPPIAKGFTAPAATIGGGAVSTPLTGTDPDGSVTSYRITSIPNDSLGTLSYCVTPPSTGCGTAISGPITLTPAQAATVAFTPAARVRVNEVPFSFTATDNTGTLSNVALVLVPLADATTLPVLLTSFNVSTQGCTALLQWTAANESYIGSFEVYQSTDNGATFNRIAQLQSSGKGVYSYTAENRKDGLYRIKVIERDGATSYSATQTAKSDCKEGTVTLYPNPVSNKVNISVSGMTGAASYELYDMTGRQLQKGVLQSDYTNTVELNGIPSGAYMIRVLTGDKVNTFKLSIAQ
jgi:hypothetical protein